MKSSLPFWQPISGIAVINLDQRPDRWQELSARAGQLPGSPQFTRIAACQGSALPGFGMQPWFRGRKNDLRWAARAGCVASHRRVMQHAQAAGWETTLVLEDDCDLTPLLSCDLNALHKALFAEHPEWDICYLGHNEIIPPARQVASWNAAGSVLQVGGCATTHAYLVRARARDWIIRQTPAEENPWRWLSRHRAIDRWYARVLSEHFQVFALSPPLLLQKTGYSDIGHHLVDWEQMDMISVAPVAYGFQQRLCLAHLRSRLIDAGDLFRSCKIRLRGF